MFVPVGCSNCGKPFQVPEETLGKAAVCPWCQSAVAALPVGAAVAPPVAPAAPLSLDDEAKPPPTEPPTRTLLRPRTVVAGLAVALVVMALTVAVRGYGSGRVPEAGWTEFTPPDGSCAVLLPSSPVEEEVGANPAGSLLAGKRYVAEGGYTRSAAWLAWGDLDPTFAAALKNDKDRTFAESAIRAELDREKARLAGTVTKEAEVRTSFGWGVEVHMDTPRGRVFERLLVAADGPYPRIYVSGLRGTNVTPDSVVVQRMFGSLRPRE